MSTAGSARADGNAADSERANLLFKKGKVAFNEGKYTDALRIYNEAWHLKQSPDIAANLAQTEAELGKHRDAAEHFAYALAHLLPSSTDEQKTALAAGLEIEKKEVGTLHVTLEPSDAAFTVDDALVTLPTNGDIYVEAGDHHASVTREGYQLNQQTLHVSKGAARVLWIRLEPAEGAAAAPASPALAGTNPSESAKESANRPSMADSEGSSGRSLLPAFVGGGIAVAGAAAGIGFLLSGNSHSNKADGLANKISGQNGCGAGTLHAADCTSLHSENQSAASARRLETFSFAVAGAAAVATVVYLLWPNGDRSMSGRAAGSAAFSAIRPTFEVARGIGTAGISGRF